ncbi:MAG TPA: hypothetical protein DHV17_07670 [Chitinophagaceae bacterium]|nr:hypothetical protein [Chitinophagaceae bacterium]
MPDRIGMHPSSMSLFDFILFFVYIFIFYLVFYWRRRRYKDPLLRKYQKHGFWIKVFSSLAYSMFVLYLSPGDTTGLFFPEGYNIYKLILKDPSNLDLLFIQGKDFDQALLANIANLGYFSEESNYLVSKIVAALSFITFGKFLVINLFFSMISFTGVWRLFRFFYEQYPDMHKQFAIGILYLPTFVFWSSGILKDPLCTGAMGWITYALYAIFIKRKNILANIIIFLLFSYLLVVLKVYIIVSYLPFFIMFLLLQNVTLIRNKAMKAFIVLGFIVGSMAGFLTITQTMQKALGNFAAEGMVKTIKTYQVNFENQADIASSNFSLGVEFDGTAQSLLRIEPAAVVATLYRPFLWESKKPSTFLSSLESLAIMLLTIYTIFRVGLRRMVSTIIKKPIVMYCLLYSLMFSLFVGATTLNFGTLVRYKIPGLPFYVIAMFLLLYFNRKPKKMPAGTDGQTELT